MQCRVDSHVGEKGTWTAGSRPSKSLILVGDALLQPMREIWNVASLPASVDAAVALLTAVTKIGRAHV